MSRQLEESLLVLHREVNGVDLDAFCSREFRARVQASEERIQRITTMDAGDALLAAATDALPSARFRRRRERPSDAFATAQLFVLGVQYVIGDEENGREAHTANRVQLQHLGASLLRSYGSTDSGDVDALIDGVATLFTTERTADAREALTAAFGQRALRMSEYDHTGSLLIEGIGAWLATLLIDLATNLPACQTWEGQIEVDGETKDVTMVEIDACTHAPFDRCKHGVNPLNWPRCNPYFLSVHPLTECVPLTDGWSADVRERVGPALNLDVYTTDLSVRYLESDDIAVVNFDLVAPSARNDDGRVEVDLGFVSVTDEGVHRRFRTMKVYCIRDMDVPLWWVCPLWCWQVVMAGWWCP